jgi:hypothetical protein
MKPSDSPHLTASERALYERLKNEKRRQAAGVPLTEGDVAGGRLDLSLPKQFKAEGLEELKRTLANVQASNPAFKHLRAFVRLEVQSEPGHGRVDVTAIIRAILSPAGARKSQVQIRLELEAHGTAVYKNWARPLPHWAIKKLPDHLTQAGEPFSRINLAGVRSLSDLWRAAGAAVLMHGKQPLKLRTSLLVEEGRVLIGDESFKISPNINKGRDYPFIRIPIEKLLKLAKP